nr:MAG TPA: hypothetical protein [Caudoviricetes sp.]DAX34124.1 MAG TPA: hypothetical protein [Caudoviricetes sp.]
MQNFKSYVAGLAIELLNNCEVYSIAEAHFNGKATFEELTLAICQNACLFSIYRVSNFGNYSTKQMYVVIAEAIMAAVQKRAITSYHSNEAIFGYIEELKVKPLHNVALYAVEAYLKRYKEATSEHLGAMFEGGKFTMLAKAVELCPLANVEAFCNINNVHNCVKCVTCYIFEQCQALPSLKAVKKYLRSIGLFNGCTPINEA